MTLQEALAVAELVEASSDWTVTAVGRFMMMDELHAAHCDGTIGKLPWMVAIMARDDVRTLTKLTSMQDWLDWQSSGRATRATKRATKPAIRESKPAKTETKSEQAAPAGMLF